MNFEFFVLNHSYGYLGVYFMAPRVHWQNAKKWEWFFSGGVMCEKLPFFLSPAVGWGPRVVVSTAAFHARVRGSVPGLGGLKETKLFLPHPRVKVSIVGSLRDREVACSASDRQGSNFESCVWRTVSSQSSHHPQEVLLAQFSLYVHKGGLKPDSFHFLSPAVVRKGTFLHNFFFCEYRLWSQVGASGVVYLSFLRMYGDKNDKFSSTMTY